MPVVLLSADLMLTSQAAGAAARQQLELVTVSSEDQLVDAANGATMAIVDLAFSGLQISAVCERLEALPESPQRIIAFGPHVHQQRLDAARAAGCDEVMSRGQFHSAMDALFAQLS